ncbi:hypothetical protein YC2023_013036 [Brassica napus]
MIYSSLFTPESLSVPKEDLTNPQEEVQPTDRSSLRICKWALKHGPISMWDVQRHHEVVPSGRVRTRNLGAGRSPSLPLDHDSIIKALEKTYADNVNEKHINRVSFLTNGHQNLNRSSVAGSTRVCNPGISQCSSFGIGLPLNVMGSLALWESELVTGEDDAYRYTYIMGLPKTLQGQRFAMPLLRIALQSPAGAARGQLADDIQNEANELSRIRDYLFN